MILSSYIQLCVFPHHFWYFFSAYCLNVEQMILKIPEYTDKLDVVKHTVMIKKNRK